MQMWDNSSTEPSEPPVAHSSKDEEKMLTEVNNGAVQVGHSATLDQVMALQEVMLQMPQAPGMDTDHFFAGGMYCRRIVIPRGTVVVSKVHKTEHLFIGCIGELEVAGQGETYVIRPGDVVPSPVGTKRVVHALSDVVVLTVHKTNRLIADGDLEEEMVEIDPLAKYDVNNQPKPGVLVGVPGVDKLEN
jgi:quercetin dioxygenase-like cupin family protein